MQAPGWAFVLQGLEAGCNSGRPPIKEGIGTYVTVEGSHVGTLPPTAFQCPLCGMKCSSVPRTGSTDMPCDYSVQARVTQIVLPPLQIMQHHLRMIINVSSPVLQLKVRFCFKINNSPFLPLQAYSRQEDWSGKGSVFRTPPTPSILQSRTLGSD